MLQMYSFRGCLILVALFAVLLGLPLLYWVWTAASLGPHDVRITSARAVSVGKAGSDTNDAASPSSLLLSVEFTSSVDLQDYDFQHKWRLGRAAYPCHDRHDDARASLMYFTSLYDRYGEIDTSAERYFDNPDPHAKYPMKSVARPRTSGPPDRNGLRHYRFYMPVSIPGPDGYDLVKSPSDVCFTVVGMNKTMFVDFRSNEAVVRKSAVVRALRRKDQP
jgi:hypothetical protein